MKFAKAYLQALSWDEEPSVLKELLGHSRWTLQYRQVFKHKDKFYETFYSKGATEQQDERPYEYEDDLIECSEVVPVEVTRTIYSKL